MSQTDHAGRLLLVAGANNGMRNTTTEQRVNRLSKAAISKQRSLAQVGILEDIIFNNLTAFNPVMQKAFGTYNIDIACGSVAIEVHNNPALPHNLAYTQKRIINLLKGGWNVIYVKFCATVIINELAINQVRQFCQVSCDNPALTSQYRVIRGTGETIAIGHLDGDNISVVAASKNLIDNSRIYKS